eukprot:TCONS_00043455-protein
MNEKESKQTESCNGDNGDLTSPKKKYRVTHVRSEAGKKRRNAKKNQNKKDKKKREYAKKVETELEKDAKIRELESKNAILSRELKSKKQPTRPFVSRFSLPRSILDSSRTKAVCLNQQLTARPTEFKRNELQLNPEPLGKGVYGKLYRGRLSNFCQELAVKEIIGQNTSLSAYVEAKIMMSLSGHKNLPLFFGWIKPNLILLEFIGSNSISSLTLHSALQIEDRKIEWLPILVDLLLAVKFVHDSGFLHNDLHGGNVLLRDLKYVKLIDFGKATFIDDPVIYNLQPGSAKQKLYNERHIHLAHELRNVPRSPQTIQTDIYSLGYILELLSNTLKNLKLANICHDMMKQPPIERLSLPQAVLKVERLKYKIN